jgi:hypothetical protein
MYFNGTEKAKQQINTSAACFKKYIIVILYQHYSSKIKKNISAAGLLNVSENFGT